MKPLDLRLHDATMDFMQQIIDTGKALCHCGAVKEPLENECSNCDHYRTEAMQDDLETARRKEQG